MRSVEFIVVTRPGHDYDSPPGARVHRLETVALPVSSSEIRQELVEGRRLRRFCLRRWPSTFTLTAFTARRTASG